MQVRAPIGSVLSADVGSDRALGRTGRTFNHKAEADAAEALINREAVRVTDRIDQSAVGARDAGEADDRAWRWSRTRRWWRDQSKGSRQIGRGDVSITVGIGPLTAYDEPTIDVASEVPVAISQFGIELSNVCEVDHAIAVGITGD